MLSDMQMRWPDVMIGSVALAAFFLLLVENSVIGEAYPWLFQTANLVVLIIFASDVLGRLLSAKDKREFLRRKWFDLIVFVPLVQYVRGLQAAHVVVMLRQVVIVTMLISRSRKAGRLLAALSLQPTQTMIAGFLFAIGIGTVLLTLPAAAADGTRTPFMDALFTATSATCVTGLVVRDTATYFSVFGQVVILSLIQVGGLGIMTFSVSLAMLLRKDVDVRQRAAVREMLDHDALSGVRQTLFFILGMTVVIELAGAAALFAAWRGRLGGMEAAYHAAFHAVSAFCNAGFSTFSDSLAGFRGCWRTNLVVSLLIIGGGLGFLVVQDLAHKSRTRLVERRRKRLRVQTRLVLTVSGGLLVCGALLLYVLERQRLFYGLGPGEGMLQAVFQSVSARTAGFNTCDIGALSAPSLLVMMVLMFIGASPGSTGGGIKTTTVAVIVAAVASGLKQRGTPELYGRSVPEEVIRKALCVISLSIGIVIVFAVLLMYVEEQGFVDVLFETVSAFGTVGLSTGVTPELTLGGKGIVTALMFIGRLGPLTLAYAFARRRLAPRYEYPEERVMIG